MDKGTVRPTPAIPRRAARVGNPADASGDSAMFSINEVLQGDRTRN
jgi:hypothetical protein